MAGTDEPNIIDQSPSKPWKLKFEDERKQIVMLWHLCHVSLIHRTQFFLLFKGDPADEIYMEVELRRLTWLEQHFAELGNASPALLGDEPAGSVSARYFSIRSSSNSILFHNNIDLDQPMIDTSRQYHVNTTNFS